MTDADPASMAYGGWCRNGHRVTLDRPVRETWADNAGKWVRCSDCGKITYCPRQKDEDVVERYTDCGLLVDADAPGVMVL